MAPASTSPVQAKIYIQEIEKILGKAFKLHERTIALNYDQETEPRTVHFYYHVKNLEMLRLLSNNSSSRSSSSSSRSPSMTWPAPAQLEEDLEKAYASAGRFHKGSTSQLHATRTPLPSLKAILKDFVVSFGMQKDSIFLDIGTGEGYPCFLASSITKRRSLASDCYDVCSEQATYYKNRHVSGFEDYTMDGNDWGLSAINSHIDINRKSWNLLVYIFLSHKSFTQCGWGR